MTDTQRLIAERTWRVLNAVAEERERQEKIGERKRARGIDWRSCADPEMGGGDFVRLAVLAEEFGEVSKEVLERSFGRDPGIDPQRTPADLLRDELIQVAAVAVAWAESLS